jgi:hypothetical protein
VNESVNIEGLPEYKITKVDLDWLLKELVLEVSLTEPQYHAIKASGALEMPDYNISIPSNGETLVVELNNKLAKMTKLAVYKSSLVGTFVVPFSKVYSKEIVDNG